MSIDQAASWKPWVLALRPQSLTASLAPVMIGTALAFTQGNIHWFFTFITLLSAFFIQTGTNLVNDAYDYKRGADSNDRLGPVRLVQGGILPAEGVHTLGLACFVLATMTMIPLVAKGGIWFVPIISLSCLCGYLYTGSSYSLAYTGLADIFVVIFFGLVLTGSTFYLQRGFVDLNVLVAGLQIGLLATVIIAVNNLRDHVQDARAGRRSLPVRFGVLFGKMEITFCALLPFVLNLYWIKQGKYEAGMFPLLTIPFVLRLIFGIWKHEPGKVYNSLFGMAALSHLLFGILFSLGILYQHLVKI